MAKYELKQRVIIEGVTLELSLEEVNVLMLALGSYNDVELGTLWKKRFHKETYPDPDTVGSLYSELSRASISLMKGKMDQNGKV